MDLREFLQLQTMYDADNGTNGGEETPEGSEEETSEGENEEDTEEVPENNTDEKTFTQAELDQIITERLAREKKKRDDAVAAAKAKAEAERLEEEGKYKELYEASQKQILASKKAELLKEAGYTKEQAELFVGLLQGETDEELESSLTLLKTANPPTAEKKKYVDPSAGNGRKNEPEKKGADEVGKSMFQRLKAKGKIK